MRAFAPLLLAAGLCSAQDDAPVEYCFDHRSLDCNIPLSVGSATLDINRACAATESLILSVTGDPALRLVRTDLDVNRHQAALSGLRLDDERCGGVHQTYHRCWWCAAVNEDVLATIQPHIPDSFCQFQDCSRPSAIPDERVNVTETCNVLRDLKEENIFPASVTMCHAAEQASYACPVFCDLPYLGADTKLKKQALIWAARLSALLSLLGASYIIYDSLFDKKNRKNVYHQLLAGMACFDVVTAFAWGWSTAAVPKDKFWIEGAIGNDMTCKSQAFFVQLGFTSVFYNVSLATYYLLVIVYAWREHALKEVRHYLHGLPLAVGLVLAVSAIPVYDWFEYGCHLLPPPDGDMLPILVFAVGPLGLAIAGIIVCMFTVYCKVRMQARTSRKWSFGVGSANTLETRVFYQSLWYVLSFLVTWPILFAMYLASVEINGPYALTLTIAFAAPLQGFNNFLVFIRPKINAWRHKSIANTSGRSSSFRFSNRSSATDQTFGGSYGIRRFWRNGSSHSQTSQDSAKFNTSSGLTTSANQFNSSTNQFNTSMNQFNTSENSFNNNPQPPVRDSSVLHFSAAETPDDDSESKDSQNQPPEQAVQTNLHEGGDDEEEEDVVDFENMDPSVLIAREDRPMEDDVDEESDLPSSRVQANHAHMETVEEEPSSQSE